ncbi:MAG: hypothetical protein WA418_22420, partial [Bradyrhizobium sp.]
RDSSLERASPVNRASGAANSPTIPRLRLGLRKSNDALKCCIGYPNSVAGSRPGPHPQTPLNTLALLRQTGSTPHQEAMPLDIQDVSN